jgi:NHL repeat
MTNRHKKILAGLAVLAVGLVGVPAAYSATPYGPVATFGAGEVEKPIGVAVDPASGDVYVASFLSAQPLAKFDPAGNEIEPPSPFGKGATVRGDEMLFSGVAVDPSNEHLYAVDAFGQQIQTYDGASGSLLASFSVTGSVNLLGLATAVQIASDAAGDVYFPNPPGNSVQVFSPEGVLLRTIAGSGASALHEPTGVALDAAGDVYVADAGNGRLEEFGPSGTFLRAIGAGVDVTTGGEVCTAASGDLCGTSGDGAQSVAVDANGSIFVGENNGAGFHIVLYSPAGQRLQDFGSGVIGTSEFGAINTLAVAPNGVLYVTDGGNSVVRVYAQQRQPAIVSTSSSLVTQTSAILDARIEAGYADTKYSFEYGTSTAYGASVPPFAADAGDGLDGATLVEQQIGGLQPATTYHYRVVATNASGQTVGEDRTFTTSPAQPPVVLTQPASGVAQSTAILGATIDTKGFETTYEFDLGTDTGYGTRIYGDAGAEPGVQTFAATLQALAPGTTYHYRIAATNVFGTTYGTDQTFTTTTYPTAALGAPPSAAPIPAPLLTTASEPSKQAGTHAPRARSAGLHGSPSKRAVHHKRRRGHGRARNIDGRRG